MSDGGETIEQEFDAGLAGGGEAEPTSQIDDVLDKLEKDWQPEAPVDVESSSVEVSVRYGLAEDQPDGKEEQQFQFSSLSEVVQSLDTAQGWEKVAVSTGGDVLKRDTKEWVYKDESGKEVSITAAVQGQDVAERHGQILENLYSQGFSVSEFQKPDSDLVVREIYFADEKGNISYEVYNFQTEPEKVLPGSNDSEFLDDGFYDDLLQAQSVTDHESAANLTAQSAAGSREATKMEAVASEIQPEVSGIELQDMDDGNLDLDEIIKPSVQAKILTTPDENLPLIENSPTLEQSADLITAVEDDDYGDVPKDEVSPREAVLEILETTPIDQHPSGSLQAPEQRARESSSAQREQVESISLAQAEIPVPAEPFEGMVIAEDLLDLGDSLETAAPKAESVMLRSGNEIVIAAIEQSPRDAVTEIHYQMNGIELLDIDDGIEDLERPVISATISETVLEPTPERRPQSVRIENESIIETIWQSPIEIEEILETPEPAEYSFAQIDVVKTDMREPVLKQQPQAEVKQKASEIIKISESVLDIEPAEVIKETNLGIEIETVQPNKPLEKSNRDVRAIPAHQSRSRQTIESIRQPTQVETAKIQPAVSKPEIRKATRDAIEPHVRTLETEPKAKEPTQPVIKLVEHKPVENRVIEKDSRAQEPHPVIEKVATAQPRIELKSTTSREGLKTAPSPRVEQIINPRRSRVDAQKLNQRIPRALSSQQASKPIIVKSAKKASPPFRPTELINKMLTFKPAVVTNDDETARNTIEAYIPEFELAA